ncbi:hypothetical protein LHP98_10960 [Rhodobacter sp. Har01]|uniref:hypothetical protein n=1 Tax=Rhodobacter sp. Har01 TaxID=2883999 RepID=UPI001D085817|nr:hypothetical protein [Rhodobacter sp. Har01]MCB6178647.1 hypothetical protein [Rhodobacter sp. Har01]
MLVRIILFLGIALVLLAGGAAGWQVLESRGIEPLAFLRGAEDAGEAEAEPVAAQDQGAATPAAQPEPAQNWLITPGGGLVDRPTVAAYLAQDRLVERRLATVIRRAPLSDLLSEGEQLPGTPFLEAFADIRAQVLADRECAALLQGFAARCEMVSAGVEEGSVDAAAGTAEFQIVVAYALAPSATPLPDLSAVVLREESVTVVPETDGAALAGSTVLDGFAKAAQDLCQKDGAELPQCRILSVSVDQESEDGASAQVWLAWLAPMPAGLYPAPPLN